MNNYNNLLTQLLEKSNFISYSSSDPYQSFLVYFSGCSTEMLVSSNKTDFFNIEFINKQKSDKISKNVNLSNLNIHVHKGFLDTLYKKHQYSINGSISYPEIDETLLSYLKRADSLSVFLKLEEKNTLARLNIREDFLFSISELYAAKLETTKLYPLKITVISNDIVYKVIIPKYDYSKYPILNYLNKEIFTETPMDVISNIDDKNFIALFEQEYLLSSIDKNNKKVDSKKHKI